MRSHERRSKRLGSLYCILLLSLTPLSAFYALFLSVQSNYSTHTNSIGAGEFHEMTSSTSSPTSSTTGLGDLALLQQQFSNPQPQHQLYLYSYFYLSSSSQQEGQERLLLPVLCKIVLPWGISVLLGLMIPLMGYVYTIFGNDQRQNTNNSSRNQEKLKSFLHETLKDFCKVLSRRDCIHIDESNTVLGTTSCNDSTAKNYYDNENKDVRGIKNLEQFDDYETNESTLTTKWIIPLAGQRLFASEIHQDNNSIQHGKSSSFRVLSEKAKLVSTLDASNVSNNKDNIKEMYQQKQQHQRQERVVGGPCVICWMSYNCGETIVWSKNPNCIHCFHKSCLISWCLSSQQQQQLRNRQRQRRGMLLSSSQRDQQQQQQQKQYFPCPCCRQAFCYASTDFDLGPNRTINPSNSSNRSSTTSSSTL